MLTILVLYIYNISYGSVSLPYLAAFHNKPAYILNAISIVYWLKKL